MASEQKPHQKAKDSLGLENRAKPCSIPLCPLYSGNAIERKRTKLNRVILLVLVFAVVFVMFPMLKMFLTPVLLASTAAALFFPFYTALLKFFRGNRGFAALSCCIIIVLGIVIPVYILGYMVTRQLFMIYGCVEPTLKMFFAAGEQTGVFARFAGNPLLDKLTQLDINWQGAMIDMVKTAGTFMAQMINKTSLGALEMVLELFITLFIMFYFFMDGERIVTKLRQLLPLRTAYQEMIIKRFLLVSRATVQGTLVIAIIQGALGAIILLVFGVKTWLLWAVVMTGMALLPMMGPWIVLLPFGVYQLATGHVWQGIVILALNFGVVSTIDNVLRPRLVGRGSRMHDLLIFFSTIGGLAAFGPVGVIMGPVIMAFFVSITEIYSMELKDVLGLPGLESENERVDR